MTDFLAHLGIEQLDWRPIAMAGVFLAIFLIGLVTLRKAKGWTR